MELTTAQKTLYKAIYERNLAFLTNSRVEAKLLNISMELRKCCCHPWLISGVEQQGGDSSLAALTNASGKMVFVQKLLAKLQSDRKRGASSMHIGTR